MPPAPRSTAPPPRPASRRLPPGHRTPLAPVRVAVVLAVLALLVSACTGENGEQPAEPGDGAVEGTSGATPSPSLDDLPVKRLSVPRGPFCGTVPDALLADALDSVSVPEVEAYGNGERARIARGLRDVAHEFSCTWEGTDTQARAWVFVPPVARGAARDLARALPATRGCSELTGVAAYGSPSVAVECRAGDRTRVLRAGLLGDAWLTCSLVVPREVPAEERVRRSDDWCAGLLTALTGPPAVTS